MPSIEQEAGISEGLSRYREQLKTLQEARDAARGLSEKTTEMEQRLAQLRSESASLLETHDSLDSLEQETALNSTITVLEAKLSRARDRQAQAEWCLDNEIQRAHSSFGTLFRIYRLWQVEREKTKLLSRMVDGCPVISIDQVVVHLKSIAALSALEITAFDPEVLVAQADRLLAALAAEPKFVVPAPSDPKPTDGFASASSEENDWTGPFDPMDGSINIQAEVRKLIAENPSLTPMTVQEPLRARFPRLFKRRSEWIAEMQTPLARQEPAVS